MRAGKKSPRPARRRIWFDVLTPKELLFFAHMMRRLGPGHDILCTTRRYGEVTSLAKIHGIRPEIVGRHGGRDLPSKLSASTSRIAALTKRVREFSPDVTVSFCSPEAARISFGLGIRHVAFNDSPHHEAALRLTVPLIQKLLIPYVIPKREFVTYGIDARDVVQYRAIDAAVTMRRETDRGAPLPFRKKNGKNILIRPEETHAAYAMNSDIVMPLTKRLASEFGGGGGGGGSNNVVVLARYRDQARSLEAELGRDARVVMMRYDGVHLLENTDVFVGSGGTMTAESALMGVPTLSYGAIPSTVERFLARMRLIRVDSDPDRVARYVRRALKSGGDASRNRARKFVSQMADPADDLMGAICEDVQGRSSARL